MPSSALRPGRGLKIESRVVTGNRCSTWGYSVRHAVLLASSGRYLLRKDERLRPVFAARMDWYENIAGEWHEDDTRGHDIYPGSNVLIVLPTSAHGYSDLLLRVLRDRENRREVRYEWLPAAEHYEPKG